MAQRSIEAVQGILRIFGFPAAQLRPHSLMADSPPPALWTQATRSFNHSEQVSIRAKTTLYIGVLGCTLDKKVILGTCDRFAPEAHDKAGQ